ncbi:MAG: acylphosphatase [Acidimicrobiales bacterium]|jgi:acylphosphatase
MAILATMGNVRRRVVISGRVQNVWFRDSCRTQALALGVTGWVRNCPSGDVEAVFEGLPTNVDHMVSWCRVGPSGARVDSVATTEEPARGETGFTIR